jgi:RNA polymerase sigma-70 factor (ECF subfamily)
MALTPGPVVALHRAVAVAEMPAPAHGPEVALTLVDALELDGHHLWHAVRADLLRRLGRRDEAAAAYGEAIARTGISPSGRSSSTHGGRSSPEADPPAGTSSARPL